MNKLGFVIQWPDPDLRPLLAANPKVIVAVENPGLIDSLWDLVPDPENTLWFYRDWSASQPLDDPLVAAEAKLAALLPVIQKNGRKYTGFELYNEIGQFNHDITRRFRDFQLKCLDGLEEKGVFGSVDNDPTWHPATPQEDVAMWRIKGEVYRHPAAKWRCRHEYLPTVFYQGVKDGWFRHEREVRWLRQNGYPVLPLVIGEFGWDKGPPLGPWHEDFGVGVDAWIRGAREYRNLLGPDVLAIAYFGAGLDNAWPQYNLLSNMAPDGIVEAVIGFMREDVAYEEPTWSEVPQAVRRWYKLLADEAYALMPGQLIEFEDVQLHLDRLLACMMMRESGPECRPDIRSVEPAGEFNGVPFYAWGLLQVIARVEGHRWFSNRPTIEELTIPAINISWGAAIYHGSLLRTGFDVWEAMRRYCGMAAPKFTMSQFWERHGKKVQRDYEAWFGILIPSPVVGEIEQLKAEITLLKQQKVNAKAGIVAIRNTANQTLDGLGDE